MGISLEILTLDKNCREANTSYSHDSGDVMGIVADQNVAYSWKEATSSQYIESARRRRDELRHGYAKLEDALPVSN